MSVGALPTVTGEPVAAKVPLQKVERWAIAPGERILRNVSREELNSEAGTAFLRSNLVDPRGI